MQRSGTFVVERHTKDRAVSLHAIVSNLNILPDRLESGMQGNHSGFR